MSQSLFLTKYTSDDNDHLYEDTSDCIETSFISPFLLQEIEKKAPLIEINIFEEKGSNESFKIDCLNNDSIEDLTERLEEIFIRMIEEHGVRKGDDSKFLSPSELQDLITDFRTITNVIYLLSLKSKKYRDDPSILITVG